MKFEDIPKVTGAIILIVVMVYALFYFATYKYRDCKKVGHTTLYCLMDLK